MVRRIGFDNEEGSGAVRRRGQRWREDRVVEVHGHDPMSPEVRSRRTKARNIKRIGVKTARDAGGAGFGRLLRNPIVLILGFILFNVFFIAFLILRAIWLSRHGSRTAMDV